MTDQVIIRHVPRDIITLGVMKEDPACEILPLWARSHLTNRDRESMARQLAHLFETEPAETDDEKDEQICFFHRDYWMEMTLKFMVDRGIDWTRHPRFTGDYVEEEEEMAIHFYEEDMKYIEGLNPNDMTTNEEKLVDQINAIGDFATCSEGAGDFQADEDSVSISEQNIGLIDGTKKEIDVGQVLGKRTEWLYLKAQKAGIGKAVIRAGGRKKEVGAKGKGRVFAGKLPKYTKLQESISDHEREMIARENHDKIIPGPLLEMKTKQHKLPCCVCNPRWQDWLRPLSRKNAITHPPLQHRDGILLIPSESGESNESDPALVNKETKV